MKGDSMVLKTNTIPPKKKKIDGFVWGFLIGMALQWIIIGTAMRSTANTMWWAATHKEEMQWVIDRYDTIQKAGHVLFFEDEMTGVTIVKPQMYGETNNK